MIVDEIMKQTVDEHKARFHHDLQQATFLHVQNIADYFEEKEEWALSDLPTMMPPWPVFWMEWRSPEKQKMENPLFDGAGWAVFGHRGEQPVEVFPADLSEPTTAFELSLAAYYVFPRRNVGYRFLNGVGNYWIAASDGRVFSVPDKNGRMVGTIELPEEEARSDDQVDFMRGFVRYCARVAGLALSFCHAKNVPLCRNEISPRLWQKQRRNGKLGVSSFYTLDIPAITSRLSVGADAGQSMAQRLHLCRGHFKDYREHGLFGRQRGIYWWDMQARGKAAMGEVRKDYRVSTQ